MKKQSNRTSSITFKAAIIENLNIDLNNDEQVECIKFKRNVVNHKGSPNLLSPTIITLKRIICCTVGLSLIRVESFK